MNTDGLIFVEARKVNLEYWDVTIINKLRSPQVVKSEFIIAKRARVYLIIVINQTFHGDRDGYLAKWNGATSRTEFV